MLLDVTDKQGLHDKGYLVSLKGAQQNGLHLQTSSLAA